MTMMRFYDTQHGFYAGIDLHARRLHLCVLDGKGQPVKDVNIAATPDAFLAAIAPFSHDLVVGHAYYMRLIHGAKAKNDKIDAHKIARLLRGGNFPLSYVYPKGMRETRDLLRRRTFLVRQRSGLLTCR